MCTKMIQNKNDAKKKTFTENSIIKVEKKEKKEMDTRETMFFAVASILSLRNLKLNVLNLF